MIFFVTPAWKRFELTEIVFEQRRRLCVEIGAQCVVIADDENLELARAQGFHTLERPNYAIGRKFNDGYEYALKHGATYVSPLGSDSFALPGYFDPLPDGKVISSTRMGMVTHGTLHILRVLNDLNPYGCGPWIIPTGKLSPRPLDDGLTDGVDRGVVCASGFPVEHRDIHPLQEVSFKDSLSVTKADKALALAVETLPLRELAKHYPADLVRRIGALYG